NIKWMIDVMGNEFRTVGFIGLYNIDLINKNAEVGIIIGDNNFRGKGIGTEALKLSCDFGFKYLGLRLIYAYILSSNTISLNLFKKNGFKEECIMHNRVFRNGLWHDIYVLTLEKEDV
ncbi:MAG: GNAT family protein, partial [Candidatus Nanoarchaeia archaeon]|nr:GNAT family N-acetyltransferase [Candidatus Jingweiarchaeum tengchongense]